VNHKLPLSPSCADFVTPVTEENAVRAIAVVAEQTVGLEVDELLLPENYLQKYQNSRSPKEIEEDLEMEVNEFTEDETEEEIVESDEGSVYGDEDNGKGKAREKVKKPTNPLNDTRAKPKKKPKPAGQVLNELVGYLYPHSRFWLRIS